MARLERARKRGDNDETRRCMECACVRACVGVYVERDGGRES